MTDWHFLPGQNFDCGQCSKCCRGWRISVDAATQVQIQGSPLERRISLQLDQPALEQRDHRFYTHKTPGGACAFLSPENLCTIQSEMGAAQKPRGCRQFPFRLCRTPDGIYAGISFYCSAAQANQGRPLPVHQPELDELAADLRMVGQHPMSVHRATRLDWQSYRLLDQFLLLQLEGVPVEQALGRGLWALCQICNKNGGPQRLAEYLERSEQALMPPAEPLLLMERHFFASLVALREAPNVAQREAFRSALLAHRRLSFGRFDPCQANLRELNQALPAFAEHELRRYLQALVFRKFLVARRTLLENAAVLYLVPALFRCWSHLSRLHRGAAEVEPVDVVRALDECEYRVITHPNDLDEFYPQAAQGFLEQVDPL